MISDYGDILFDKTMYLDVMKKRKLNLLRLHIFYVSEFKVFLQGFEEAQAGI